MKQTTITRQDFFFCYDIRLSNYLIKSGFNFITYAIHPKSHKTFYMFYKVDGLNEAISSFKQNRKVESTEGF